MLGQFVRIACMWRLGCIPSRKEMNATLHHVAAEHERRCAATEPKRSVRRYEIASAWDWAVECVTHKTDKQVHAELGHHEHTSDESRPDIIPLTEPGTGSTVPCWRSAPGDRRPGTCGQRSNTD